MNLRETIQAHDPDDGFLQVAPEDLVGLTTADLKLGVEIEVDDSAKEIFGDILLYRHEPGARIACCVSIAEPTKCWNGTLGLLAHLKLMEHYAYALGGERVSWDPAEINDDGWGEFSFSVVSTHQGLPEAYAEILELLRAIHQRTDQYVREKIENLLP